MKILAALAVTTMLICLGPSEAIAQSPLPPSTEGTALPGDFPIQWMRGLVLVDDPKGARVIAGAADQVGSVFTLINDQPVASVADLIARLRAADPKTVKITSVKTEEVTTPRYVDWWAESLKYVDGPHGVLITSSNFPGETGNYLTRLNDVEIKHASDVRPILMQITNDLSRFRSIQITDPPAEDKAWAATAVAAQSQDPLPAVVRQSWGPLADLPGKLWYCNAHDPLAWRLRHPTNRLASMPVARLVAAEWLTPYSAMKLTEREGSQTITDVISVQPDGSFALASTGVDSYPSLVGRLAKDGQIYFQMGTYPGPGNMQLTDFLTFGLSGNRVKASIHVYSGTSDLDDHSICTLEEFDELKVPRFARDLQAERKQDGDWAQAEANDDAYTAQLQAEGAQMAASMRASAMAEFAKIPQVAAQASQQRADLDQMRLAAEAETARNKAAAAGHQSSGNATIAQAQQQQNSNSPAATASPAPLSAGSPTQAHAAREPKTFRAYFETSYVNPDDADHNTFCQSNIFSFTVPSWSSDTSMNDIDAVLGPMKPTFAQKCVEAAGRPLAANSMYEVEIYGRVLELKPLRAGDHQVTMP